MNKLAVGAVLLAGMLALGQLGQAAVKAKPVPQRDGKLVVLYLHTHARCISCMKIEKFTKEAVEAGFAPELKSGRVEFKSIDVQDEGNEHYATDYQIPTKSVVLSRLQKGKELSWKLLPKVWPLLRDDKAFKTYIQEEMRRALKGL